MLCLLQGYAVKAGMLVGRGELLLFMDADGATRVSDLEKLEAALAAMCSGQCALAFTSASSQRKLDSICNSMCPSQSMNGRGMQETQQVREVLGKRQIQCARGWGLLPGQGLTWKRGLSHRGAGRGIS